MSWTVVHAPDSSTLKTTLTPRLAAANAPKASIMGGWQPSSMTEGPVKPPTRLGLLAAIDTPAAATESRPQRKLKASSAIHCAFRDVTGWSKNDS